MLLKILAKIHFTEKNKSSHLTKVALSWGSTAGTELTLLKAQVMLGVEFAELKLKKSIWPEILATIIF